MEGRRFLDIKVCCEVFIVSRLVDRWIKRWEKEIFKYIRLRMVVQDVIKVAYFKLEEENGLMNSWLVMQRDYIGVSFYKVYQN